MYKKMLSLSNYNLIHQVSFVPFYKFNYFDPLLTSIMIPDDSSLDYPFANSFKIHLLFFVWSLPKEKFEHFLLSCFIKRKSFLCGMVLFIFSFTLLFCHNISYVLVYEVMVFNMRFSEILNYKERLRGHS